MAVSADELALLELGQREFAGLLAREATDGRDLVAPGQVIPMHDKVRKDLAAVSTRKTGLQSLQPVAAFSAPRLLPA